MSRVMRKPLSGVSVQVQHNPGCTVAEDGLEILEVEELYYICVANTKPRLPRSWSAPLYFEYEKSRLSHYAARPTIKSTFHDSS